ncbi:MAG: hypothetical protein ACTHQ3_20220 [Motilibacteraceae bacterium]
MYAWIWRHLPGRWPLRALTSLLLAGAVVAALFTVVFPWAEHSLPFLQVTVDSSGSSGGSSPSPTPTSTGSGS